MFLNVVLGHKQDLTDCAENLDKENPSTRSLLWLQLVPIFQKSAAKSCKIGQRFNVADAMHGCQSPMNVPKRCLGTQTRPDRLRGEPRQGKPPSTRSLLWLRLMPIFQKSAAKSCKIGQRFNVANATHGCQSPMNVPKRCLGTQTRPDRLRGEPREGEPFHALTPLAPTRADFSEISAAKSIARSG